MKKLKLKIIELIQNNNLFRKIFLSFSIWLNNFSYSLIKAFIVRDGEIHPKHRIMNYHKFFIDNTEKNDIVLDIGCGNGALTHDVSKKAKKVIGIDRAEKNIKIANEKFNNDNLKFILGDAIKFNFSSLGIKKFDKIILSNVLEHIDKRVEFLKDLHKLSDTILLRVPMISRDWLSVYKKENGYRYFLSGEHFIEYTQSTLENELLEGEWELDKYSVQFGETWAVVKSK